MEKTGTPNLSPAEQGSRDSPPKLAVSLPSLFCRSSGARLKTELRHHRTRRTHGK